MSPAHSLLHRLNIRLLANHFPVIIISLASGLVFNELTTYKLQMSTQYYKLDRRHALAGKTVRTLPQLKLLSLFSIFYSGLV